MASGQIQNSKLQTAVYNFTNLAQYSTFGYYLDITNVHSKMGIPTNALIVSATVHGWGYLGSGPISIGTNGNDGFWLLYQNGFTITSNSYVIIRAVYQL